MRNFLVQLRPRFRLGIISAASGQFINRQIWRLCLMMVVFVSVAGAVHAQTIPAGPYQKTCNALNIQRVVDVEKGFYLPIAVEALSGNCLNYNFGGPANAASRLLSVLKEPNSCPKLANDPSQSSIYNVNGQLMCVIPGMSGGSGAPAVVNADGSLVAGAVDIVGHTQLVMPTGTIDYWTVNQPNIRTARAYTFMKYRPGDFVTFWGGGCVGESVVDGSAPGGEEIVGNLTPYVGHSATESWPSYGQVTLPGVLPSVTPLVQTDETFGQALQAVAGGNPDAMYPTLSFYIVNNSTNAVWQYNDNDRITFYGILGDNPYSFDGGSIDNGRSDSSCKLGQFNLQPAFFSLEVAHSVAPPILQYSLGKLPFDVEWRTQDYNFLPTDVIFHSQEPEKASPSEPFPAPKGPNAISDNFNGICGPAFSTPGDNPLDLPGAVLGVLGIGNNASPTTSVDQSYLDSHCTGQPVTVDQFSADSNFGSKILNLLGTTGFKKLEICPPEPIRGHLNWFPVTQVGTLHFADYSGEWPNDDDANMSLSGMALTSGSLGAVNGGSETSPYGGYLLEFDDSELSFQSDFWKKVQSDYHNFWWSINAPWPFNGDLGEAQAGLDADFYISIPPYTPRPQSDKIVGVVTGLFGVDGVHSGGISELHPVFSVAVELGSFVDDNQNLVQEWAVFIRNFGDEGSCSANVHSLIPVSSGGADYYISFPWPVTPRGDPVSNNFTTAYSQVALELDEGNGGWWPQTPQGGGGPSAKLVASTLDPTIPITANSSANLDFNVPGAVTGTNAFNPWGYDGVIRLTYSANGQGQSRIGMKRRTVPGSDAAVKQTSPINLSGQVAKLPGPEVKLTGPVVKFTNDTPRDNDAEDFPWQEMLAAETDPAVIRHLKSYLSTTPAVTRLMLVPAVPIFGSSGGGQVSVATAESPSKLTNAVAAASRTRVYVDVNKQRRLDDVDTAADLPHLTFQAPDASHVFVVQTNGHLRYVEAPFRAGDNPDIEQGKWIDSNVSSIKALSTDEILVVRKDGGLFDEKAPFSGSGSLCVEGFVWRQNTPDDHVCVSPNPSNRGAADDVFAAERRAGAGTTTAIGWRLPTFDLMPHAGLIGTDLRGNLQTRLSGSSSGDSNVAPHTYSTVTAIGYSTLATQVRAFQVVSDAEIQVLSADDTLTPLYWRPTTGSPVGTPNSWQSGSPRYNSVWDFQKTEDGSLFVIYADDTLWLEPAHTRINVTVKKIQAIDSQFLYLLQSDGSLFAGSPADLTPTIGKSIVTPFATNVRDFRAVDDSSVFFLDQYGQLWFLDLAKAGGGRSLAPTSSRILVATNVR